MNVIIFEVIECLTNLKKIKNHYQRNISFQSMIKQTAGGVAERPCVRLQTQKYR